MIGKLAIAYGAISAAFFVLGEKNFYDSAQKFNYSPEVRAKHLKELPYNLAFSFAWPVVVVAGVAYVGVAAITGKT